MSCPDGWAVCGFERCNSFSPTTGWQLAGTAHTVALEEVDDPCDLWYWDKSEAPNNLRLRARDSFEISDTTNQQIIIGEDEVSYGYVSCREACLADEDCVGGYAHALAADPNWTFHCTLLKASESPLAASAELAYPLPFQESSLNERVSNMFEPSFSLMSGVFSVCADPQPLRTMPDE